MQMTVKFATWSVEEEVMYQNQVLSMEKWKPHPNDLHRGHKNTSGMGSPSSAGIGQLSLLLQLRNNTYVCQHIRSGRTCRICMFE